jgi:hypothetical protein
MEGIIETPAACRMVFRNGRIANFYPGGGYCIRQRLPL